MRRSEATFLSRSFESNERTYFGVFRLVTSQENRLRAAIDGPEAAAPHRLRLGDFSQRFASPR